MLAGGCLLRWVSHTWKMHHCGGSALVHRKSCPTHGNWGVLVGKKNKTTRQTWRFWLMFFVQKCLVLFCFGWVCAVPTFMGMGCVRVFIQLDFNSRTKSSLKDPIHLWYICDTNIKKSFLLLKSRADEQSLFSDQNDLVCTWSRPGIMIPSPSSNRTTGLSAVHAESGVGKSIATVTTVLAAKETIPVQCCSCRGISRTT